VLNSDYQCCAKPVAVQSTTGARITAHTNRQNQCCHEIDQPILLYKAGNNCTTRLTTVLTFLELQQVSRQAARPLWRDGQAFSCDVTQWRNSLSRDDTSTGPTCIMTVNGKTSPQLDRELLYINVLVTYPASPQRPLPPSISPRALYSLGGWALRRTRLHTRRRTESGTPLPYTVENREQQGMIVIIASLKYQQSAVNDSI
jgi:hypothetical protein